MVKKVLAVLCMGVLLFLGVKTTKANDVEEYWELDKLIELGAEVPDYNTTTGLYEIGKPEQLLFMTGDWKPEDTNADGFPDAPRDGNYILTADLDMTELMVKIGGYMPPMSAAKEESGELGANGRLEKGWFLGSFNGDYHSISNLNVYRPGKYVGLFGYIGYQWDEAIVKNLALINVHVEGVQNVGAITGVCYGRIENCVVTGTVIGSEEGSNGHTAGGIAGKVKEGEGPIMGHIENCFAYVNVVGLYDVGGIAGIQDGGGYIGNCFTGGSLVSSDDKAHTGGIVGAYNAGEDLENCMSAFKTIKSADGAVDVDKIVGQLAGESASSIINNYVWEGTDLEGNEPNDHPNKAVQTNLSSTEILSKSTYVDKLGWNFELNWEWIGELTNGYPMIKGFGSKVPNMMSTLTSDLTVEKAAINLINSVEGLNPQVNVAEFGQEAPIIAQVIAPEGDVINSVSLYYGVTEDGASFTNSIEMILNADGYYECNFPTDEKGTFYYYVSAKVGERTVTKPYYTSTSIKMLIDDGVILGTPTQITLTPGSVQGKMGFNWLTVTDVKESILKYRVKGTTSWKRVKGTSYTSYITKGWEEIQSHSANTPVLKGDTFYEYMVGGSVDGQDFYSEIYTFKAPTHDDEFTFMYVSDPQSESAEDYEPFASAMEHVLTNEAKYGTIEFLLNTGDITQNGYKGREWKSFFEMLQPYLVSMPTISIPGNHELKGDAYYKQYSARFNMPGGNAGTEFDDTIGYFEYGEACIVVINSQPSPVEDTQEIWEQMEEWAEDKFEESDKQWRILVTHAGPYTSNHPGATVAYLAEMADNLKVDLFLNGHDHIYLRGTVIDKVKVEPGEGTTYVTGGTIGNKYYQYNNASDPYIEVHLDDEDMQIFNMITVTPEKIAFTAYRVVEEEEFGDWEVVDQFDITKSLSKGTYAEGKKK